MLKSIGRSSHFWAKNCWRHCLPAASAPQDYFAALCQHGDGGRRGFGWPGDASCALTFQPSNHSFIQVFEMQPPHFTLIAQGHDMPSDHTRAAILNSAERLYADRGFADVTLRDIVAVADVNLAAVNYHFGSKDELIAELFVTRSLATNRERLNELKAAEEAGGGRADINSILRALVGPTLRGCLGPDRERSTAARFMIRASIESVPPIRRIKNREKGRRAARTLGTARLELCRRDAVDLDVERRDTMKKSRPTGGSFNHEIDLLGPGHAGDMAGRIAGRAGTTFDRASNLHLLSGSLARSALCEHSRRRSNKSGRRERDDCEFHCKPPWNYPTDQ